MIQLVADRPLPPTLQGRRLADPDLLIAIAQRPPDAEVDYLRSFDEFSYILSDLRMGGTWKRTKAGRLGLTEEMICQHLIPSNYGKVAVLDVGASGGITTLELSSTLRRRFGDRVLVTLTDLNVWLLRYRAGPLCEYRSANDEPIMVRVGRLALRLSQERHNVTHAGDRLAQLYLRFAALRRGMKLDAKISLIHPLVQREPIVTVMQLDCLVKDDALKFKFDAVRASNVLNSDYFSPAQINTALGNLHSYMREGACLVVSRNTDKVSANDAESDIGETENGSVWRKVGSGFSHLADFGAGSEIRGFVDDWTSE